MCRSNGGRFNYLGHAGRENHHFVQLSHPLHELVDARSFYDIDIVKLAFYFNWNGKVGLVENLRQVSHPQPATVRRTLKLLCTSVSSKSSTKHFLPLISGRFGGRSHLCMPSGPSLTGLPS
jgi:hypothetical protein